MRQFRPVHIPVHTPSEIYCIGIFPAIISSVFQAIDF
jgi:hypothetical protein